LVKYLQKLPSEEQSQNYKERYGGGGGGGWRGGGGRTDLRLGLDLNRNVCP